MDWYALYLCNNLTCSFLTDKKEKKQAIENSNAFNFNGRYTLTVRTNKSSLSIGIEPGSCRVFQIVYF